MKNLILMTVCLVILINTQSCGKLKVDANIPDTNHQANVEANVKVSVDLEAISNFCDNRYAYIEDEIERREASEACFKDAINFLDIGLSITSDIPKFCESQYNKPQDIEACENDLLNALGGE